MSPAGSVLGALGGVRNVVALENYDARLRVEVVRPELVDDVALRDAGALAVVRSGHVVQIVLGAIPALTVLEVEDAVRCRREPRLAGIAASL